MDKSVQLEPENPYRYSSRAYIKNAIQDVDGAISDYKKALELDPKDMIALNNLGLLEEKLGRMTSAQKLFQKADKEAKEQGFDFYDSEEGLKRAREQAQEEIKKMQQKESQQSEDNHESESTKEGFLKTAFSVFTSKEGFQDYLKFLKGIFSKKDS